MNGSPIKTDGTSLGSHDAGDGIDGGRFPGPVCTEKGHHLPGLHDQANIEKGLVISVEDAELFNL
jgi:hypothetical protein